MTRVKDRAEVSDEFLEKTVVIRGTTYKFRELSAEKYEEILQLAEGPDGNADLATVLKLMIPESMIEPKMSTEAIFRKPLPVITAIQTLVNQMHFSTEPTGEPEAEEEGPGNESAEETSSS